MYIEGNFRHIHFFCKSSEFAVFQHDVLSTASVPDVVFTVFVTDGRAMTPRITWCAVIRQGIWHICAKLICSHKTV
jgi:hypothetical protein